MLYLWFKVFHIVGFVAWFAGIFYIWRLFVYHAEAESDEVRKTLALMEVRLYRIIMLPAMAVTLFFGLALLGFQWKAFTQSLWLWGKLSLVLLVMVQHFLADHYRKRLAAGEKFSSKRFRLLNEVPVVFLLGIVILVVVKPF